MRFKHVPTKYPEECQWALRQPDRHDGYTRCMSWDGCKKRCQRQNYKAREAQRIRRQEGTHPRSFPRPKNNGGCSWCGEAVLKADGLLDTRRGWHSGRHGEPECLEAFFLHTRPENQRAHLMRRDGPRCADCHEAKGRWADRAEVHPGTRAWSGWERIYPPAIYAGPFCRIQWSGDIELEHNVPLWSVAHLPDDERSVYFGPVNLVFRCAACHAAKTRLEAAERAVLRRAPAPPAQRCGLCVTRNAIEDAPEGCCSRMGTRKAQDPACDQFFPLGQLRAALYGKKTSG